MRKNIFLAALTFSLLSGGAFSAQAACNGHWCVSSQTQNPYAQVPMGKRHSVVAQTPQYWMPVPPGTAQKPTPHPSRIKATKGKAADVSAIARGINPQTGFKNSRGRKWDALVGVSAGAIPEYVGGSQYVGAVLPFVIASYRPSEKTEWRLNPFEGASYAYKLHRNMEVGLNAMPRRGREAEDDHNSLVGMPDVDPALEVGPWIQWRLGKFTYVRTGLGVDVLDGHGGQVVNIEAGVNYPVSHRFSTGFAIRGLYGDDDYMKTYYTVTQAQKRRNRGGYTAREGFSEIGIRANAMLWVTPKVFARTDVFATALQGDASDSTLVKKPETFGGLFTVGYRF